MKTKTYKYGKFTFKAYHKTVGHGYEVGLTYGTKPIFVGNFIHATEANQWWTLMNKELKTFTKRYWVNPKVSASFYCNFVKNHFYKKYYTFVNKLMSKHTRTYSTKFNKDVRKYKTLKKNWTPSTKAKPIRTAS